ncbi:Membrane protein involved in the export of O-antigen and teichoic acid [Rhizobiales bacterium GAS188]|nr:Membrane protein involved in the export of O-antigen and teichoic acid [Rhizobiales bacterium GAS188]
MLLYHTLLYLPAQLLGPAFQLLAAVVWTHWLSPSEYGVLALIIAAQELVFSLCLSWWSQYTTRYYAAHQEEGSTARFQPTENSVLLGSVLLQTLVASIALAFSDARLDLALVGATVLFTVTRSIATYLGERARASGRIAAYTLAQTSGPVIGCLIGFAVVLEGHASATAVLAGFAIAQTLTLPVLWRMLGLGAVLGLDRGILSIAIRYGAPLLGAGVISWASVNGLRVVVDVFNGAADVGLISVGWNLGQRAAVVAAMLVTAAAYPLAVRRAVTHSRGAALAQLAQAGALLLGVLAPIAVGLLIVNRTAVELLIGPEFQSITIAILPIAVLSGAIRNLRMHYADQTFLLCERSDIALMVCAIEAVLVVPLCIIGLLVKGLVGACLGCLAGHALAAVIIFILAVGRFRLPVPWAHFGRIALATLCMAGLLEGLPWAATRLGLIAEVAAGGLAYAVVIALLYRRELRALLAAWIARSAAPAAP